MSIVTTENRTHNANILAAEMTRQVAVANAANQAAVILAEIAHYRTCLKSAIANGCGQEPFIAALRTLAFPGCDRGG